MAKNSATRGRRGAMYDDLSALLPALADGSVAMLIGLLPRILGRGFVDHRIADSVFFARPVAQIQQAAALAAEWEISGGVGVGRLAANRTLILHVYRIP